jgi:hypothetical protein
MISPNNAVYTNQLRVPPLHGIQSNSDQEVNSWRNNLQQFNNDEAEVIQEFIYFRLKWFIRKWQDHRKTWILRENQKYSLGLEASKLRLLNVINLNLLF